MNLFQEAATVLKRTHDIMVLSAEAAGIMARAHQQGDAYGAFNFGSNNRYDTYLNRFLDDESDSLLMN